MPLKADWRKIMLPDRMSGLCSRPSSSISSRALRDGDQYFYLNETFTPQEMQILQQGNTLTKIIEANTDVTNLQSDVFTLHRYDQWNRHDAASRRLRLAQPESAPGM